MKKKIILIIFVIIFIFAFYYYKSDNKEELLLGDTYLIGDVDGNGKISVSDYTLVKSHILGIKILTGDKFKRADVNKDNKITTSDYNSIRKMIVNNTKIIEEKEESLSRSSFSELAYQFPKVIDMGDYYEVVDFSVVDFGADSTGKTDSSAAFNNAAREALGCAKFGPDHNGNKLCSGAIYVPEGVYLLEQPIVLGSYVKLVGEPNKTVLLINHGQNSESVKNAAVKADCMSSIKNIIFYYPQQIVTKTGDVNKYPPTITFGQADSNWSHPQSHPSDGISLENITFINSYIAMDFSTVNGNNSVFFLKNIYGTPLKTGILNDENIDTIKMDNINFSYKYWLLFSNKKTINLKNGEIKSNVLDKHLNGKKGSCGFYKTVSGECTLYEPVEVDLKTSLKNNTRRPVGIELKRVDWAFLAKINISGYYSGVRLSNSTRGVNDQVDGGRYVNTEGEMFDSKILDCIYPLDVVNSRHFVLTNVNLDSNGGAAIKVDNNSSKDTKVYNIDSEYSVYNSTISNYNSNQYAINYGGKGPISITNSKVYGKINIQNGNKLFSFSGSSLLNTGIDSVTHDKNNKNCYVEATPSIANSISSEYDKAVKTKPTSSLLSVISIDKGSYEIDITNAINNAINKLAVKENGKTIYKGIVYIPNGRYKISNTINVPSGVEIRGGATWAHHTRYLGEYAQNVGTTVIDVTPLNGKTAFKLNSNSGLNGFDLITTKKNTNSAYTIDGSGNNIYVINMSLPGLYNGIHINGANHFIEHIWGVFYNNGIKVEGSKGIIRNCHFTPKAMIDKSSTLGNDIRNNQTTIQVGSTDGEIIFHVFTIGQKKAFVFNGAKNFTAIGIGADGSTLYGVEAINSTGKVVNSHIVTGVNSDGKSDIHRYFKTNNSNIEIINSINRANTKETAFEFNGGEVKLIGGIIKHYSNQAIKASSTKVTSVGIIFVNSGATKYNLSSSNLISYGNVCSDSKNGVESCTSNKNLVKNGNSSITNFDYKTSCQSPVSSSSTLWLTFNLRKTSAYQPTKEGPKKGVTTICGIPSGYTKFRYRTNTDASKDGTIKSGCVTITISPAKNQVLRFQLIGNDNTPEYTVNDIGKYLIFAQAYNYFLYVEKDENKNIASNDINNLTGWVLKNQSVSQSISSISNTGIKNKANYSDLEFVEYAYHGIFGRAVDPSGLDTWTKKLNSGMTRVDLVKYYINHNEAKTIYSGWGYN